DSHASTIPPTGPPPTGLTSLPNSCIASCDLQSPGDADCGETQHDAGSLPGPGNDLHMGIMLSSCAAHVSQAQARAFMLARDRRIELAKEARDSGRGCESRTVIGHFDGKPALVGAGGNRGMASAF